MTDQNPGSPAPEQPDGQAAAAPQAAQPPSGAPEPAAPQPEPAASEPAAPQDPDALPGVGPFTRREAILVGLSGLILLLSFFSIYDFGYMPIWGASLDWVLAVGLPVAAGVLLVLRRTQPGRIARVGSLSVDQFASVSFSVAAVMWLSTLGYGLAVDGPGVITTWVVWLQLLATLGGVFLTVVAPHVAPFKEDFERRAETPAHPTARDPRGVIVRPKPQPVAPQQWAQPAPPYGAPQQGQPYGAPGYGQPAYGAPQPGQPPYAPQPYGQAPYGQPYGQQPYGQPSQPYGQPAYAPSAGRFPVGAPAYGQQYPLQAPAPAAAADADATHQRPASPEPAEAPQAQPEPVGAPATDDDATSVLPAQDEPTGPTEAYPAAEPAPEPESAPEPAPAPEPEPEPESEPEPAAAQQAPVQQAFWALVPEERDVVDAYGAPLFRIGPTAWALVVEDRGDTYVVRHDDGRIGYLHDTSGITRG